MKNVHLPTDAERDAIDFAITVNADHYRDTGKTEHADALEEARDTIQTDGYIPAAVVSLVWDILMELDHLKIASRPDYNNGEDRTPLIDAVYHIIVFNGDELYTDFTEYRARLRGIDPDRVLVVNGTEITVPEGISLIDDPEDASGEFARAEYYEDFSSSAWYSSVTPNAGSSDRGHEKIAEDEPAAVQRAIRLAEKHEVPLLRP